MPPNFALLYLQEGSFVIVIILSLNFLFKFTDFFVNRDDIEKMKISLEQANNSLAESESRLVEKSKQLEVVQHSFEQLENKFETTKEALQEAQTANLQKDNECEGIYI